MRWVCVGVTVAALASVALMAGGNRVDAGPEVASAGRAEAGSDRSASGQPHRSPVDLVLEPQGRWLATANQSSGTISLVRTSDGRVLDELAVGNRPAAIALAPDGRRLLVTSSYSGELTVVEVEAGRLRERQRIDVGFEPYGVAVAPDGRTAYVAQFAADAVAVVDLDAGRVTHQIPVGRWPRYLALSQNGNRLAVGIAGDGGVAVVDTQRRRVDFVSRFGGINLGQMQIDRDGRFVYFPYMLYRANPITPGNIRQGWVLASRVARVRLDRQERREAVSLDPRGRAVADPHGFAITAEGTTAVLSASGTHELIVLAIPGLPFVRYGGSGDHIDPALLADAKRFARIALGGRPMGLRIGPDDRTVYVANYLKDCVQVVDLASRRLVGEFALGGPDSPDLVRQGEALFYDARRSLDQWYSCHTCHYQGGSNSDAMDTWNDESSFTFKTVLPLFHVEQTPPWTWHGLQSDLTAALRKSLTSTLQGPPPSDQELAALRAFVSSLQPPPNPYRASNALPAESVRRGKELFHSDRAGCAGCHSGPYFTDGQTHDVGLAEAVDRHRTFNTPSLRGVYRRRRFLHDGRCRTLEEVLTGPHSPEKVSGTAPLSRSELEDLINYLKTL